MDYPFLARATPAGPFAAGDRGALLIVTATASDGSPGRRLRLCHPADPARLRVLRRQVRRWAAAHAVPAAVVDDLQLVVEEAVSNGVEHAYRSCPSGTVEVELELRPADHDPVVMVSVTDHGRWRPAPLRPRGRGRGLTLISQLTRGLEIAITTGGTRLTCAVPVRG